MSHSGIAQARFNGENGCLSVAGYERTIWIDADVLIFDREGFDIPLKALPLFCREIWVAGKPDNLRTKERINNSRQPAIMGSPGDE